MVGYGNVLRVLRDRRISCACTPLLLSIHSRNHELMPLFVMQETYGYWMHLHTSFLVREFASSKGLIEHENCRLNLH